MLDNDTIRERLSAALEECVANCSTSLLWREAMSGILAVDPTTETFRVFPRVRKKADEPALYSAYRFAAPWVELWKLAPVEMWDGFTCGLWKAMLSHVCYQCEKMGIYKGQWPRLREDYPRGSKTQSDPC